MCVTLVLLILQADRVARSIDGANYNGSTIRACVALCTPVHTHLRSDSSASPFIPPMREHVRPIYHAAPHASAQAPSPFSVGGMVSAFFARG